MEHNILQLKSLVYVISLPYFLYAFFSSVIIRLILTLLRCYRYVDERVETDSSFWGYFGRLMIGRVLFNCSRDKLHLYRGDYLVPFILGFIELLTFPLLFKAGLDTYVGAWIGLKLVANYKHWADDPIKFNTFLLGNALVLLLSFTLLYFYIEK